MNKNNPITDAKRIATLISFILIVIALFILDRASNKPSIRNQCKLTSQYTLSHQINFNDLFPATFDRSQRCGNNPSCLPKLKKEISELLGNDYFQMYQPESTYFVRANNGLIEKMFLGGDYYAKTPETWREKFFLWHLTHNLPICDYFWKFDLSTTSMTYLRDFTSEAEMLIPFKTNKDYHVGIVRVWGD